MNNDIDPSVVVQSSTDLTICSAIERVECSVVNVAHLPPGIRFDYFSYEVIVAQEWVCPRGRGLIGELGRQWWVERIRRVPSSIDEAYAFAQRLPRPEEVKVEVGSGCVRSITYPGEIGSIDGATSLFYRDVDQEAERSYIRDLKTENEERRAGRYYGASSLPKCVPAWWRLEYRNNTSGHALSDPLDRRSITDKQKRLVNDVLTAHRRHINDATSFRYGRTRKGLEYKYTIPFRAVFNLCLAYTIEEPPLAEELLSINYYYRDQPVMTTHKDAILQKLRAFEYSKWLDGIIEPRIDYIRSFPPEHQKQISSMLGIGMSGCMLQPTEATADTISVLSPPEWYPPSWPVRAQWIPCVDIVNLLSTDNYTLKRSLSGGFPFFMDEVQKAVRESINLVRIDLGLPKMGEGWVTEIDLYNRVKALLPGEMVIHQGQPKWLGRQRFDIWIPGRNMAIEYHGEQHFSEVSIFGGKTGFEKVQKLDTKKRRLCLENGVELVEIAFNDDRSDEWLSSRLRLN